MQPSRTKISNKNGSTQRLSLSAIITKACLDSLLSSSVEAPMLGEGALDSRNDQEVIFVLCTTVRQENQIKSSRDCDSPDLRDLISQENPSERAKTIKIHGCKTNIPKIKQN